MQSQRAPATQPQATSSSPYTTANMNSSVTQHQPSPQQPRQPQANSSASSQPYQWSSASSQSIPPGFTSAATMRSSHPMPPQPGQGQFVSGNGGMPGKVYGSSMWGGGGGGAGQMGVYGMGQRGGVPMGGIPDERRRQMLRMQQEQMIQAHQARRMAAQQQQQGAMYPAPGMMVGAGPPGMPPGYSQSSSMGGAIPPNMPPGPMNM